MAAAGTLKLDDLSGGDSDSELDLTAPARVLCIISSGGFHRSNVNVALVKSAIASKVGIQGGGGGVDFSDVSLPLVNSAETRDGWVMRAIGGRGPALLGAWAGSGPHSTSVEITPSDGGASGPVRIVVDSVHLPCNVRGDWGAGQLCAAAESLLCARRFGLGAFSGPSLKALADEALGLVRATEGGKQRLAGLLFSAGALPVRPLFKDEEPESPGGVKRRRGDNKEESEVELGEASLMTKVRDSLWGATLTGLAVRTGGLSEYSPGFSDEDVHAVAATVAAGVAGTTPAVVEKILEHGLKFFIRAGQCSARPVDGTKRYFLSFTLFGDNPNGPTGAATGGALDPVSEA